MKVSLVVTTAGKAQGQAIAIKLPQFIIGRDPQCNLRPASALISKRHCALLVKGNQVFVRDFDSTNGTFVNEQPVKGEAPLQNEDILKVGPLSFKVQIEGSSISKPTPPPQQGSADDEDAAAMLLALQDDGTSGELGATEDSAVPSGSTVFDLPNSLQTPGEGTGEGDKKPDAKKPDAKAAAVSASKAAEALLAKYSRRQR